MLTRPHLSRERSCSRGFSLIELSVALIVLTLVLAATLPAAADWMKDLRMRGVAESFKTGLDRARMDALKANRAVSFWVVSDPSAKLPDADCRLAAGGTYWVVSVDDPTGACNALPSTKDAPRLAYRSQGGLDIKDVVVAATDVDGNPSAQVTFNSLGQVQGAGMIRQIEVQRVLGARTLRILIEPGGSVRTCDPRVAADDPRACP